MADENLVQDFNKIKFRADKTFHPKNILKSLLNIILCLSFKNKLISSWEFQELLKNHHPCFI